MKRAKTICKRHGCTELVDGFGYCDKHLGDNKKASESLRGLDAKKTPEQKRFYSSNAWTQASLRHRQGEPMCRRCYDKGLRVIGTLVHHNPPLDELVRRGLNPTDDEYLETLCDHCHLEELRNKRIYKSRV